jgi:hypothetical protein
MHKRHQSQCHAMQPATGVKNVLTGAINVAAVNRASPSAPWVDLRRGVCLRGMLMNSGSEGPLGGPDDSQVGIKAPAGPRLRLRDQPEQAPARRQIRMENGDAANRKSKREQSHSR